MQLVYLDDALDDLIWMCHYYEHVFSAGNRNAQNQFHLSQSLILENPYIGHPVDIDDVREFSILKTPFSFIYQLKVEKIEVLRVWDERGDRSNLG